MLNDEQRFPAKMASQNSNFVAILPLSTNPFTQTPFFRQASNSKPNFHQFMADSASHVVGQLHQSIISNAHNFFKMLHILASKNPIFCKLVSFTSHLQSFSCKIPCTSYGNARLNHNFAAILPGDSVAGIVATNGILNFLNIYNTLLVVRIVLTWFPNAPSIVVSPLSTLCDPYLNIFRGIIPPLGGTLDLSPILAFFVLNVFTGAAAALPAELPSTGASQNLPSHQTVSHTTTSQRKWMRRLAGDKSKNSCTNH